MRLRVVLEAQGPLALGTGIAAQNFQLTRSHVPGAVWRGALAQEFLAGLGERRFQGDSRESASDPDFQTVFFGPEPARFGSLYPLGAALAPDFDPFPVPLTARTCKVGKGFTADRGGHGVWDRLLPNLRQLAQPGPERRGGACRWLDARKKECGERLDRFRVSAVRTGTGRNDYRQVKPRKRVLVRVGLNRTLETAEEQILYALEALVPGPDRRDRNPEDDGRLLFAGICTLADEQKKALDRLLQRFLVTEEGGYPVRLGTARARGLGRALLRLEGESAPAASLEERLKQFQPKETGKDDLYFALTLRSPLLWHDAVGQLVMRADMETLRDYCARMPDGIHFLSRASAVEAEECSGWSPAWGLPKPVVQVLAPGSVLAFRAPASERQAVLDFLDDVEQQGLGDRRAEGLGEVVACDPFHVTFDGGAVAGEHSHV